MISFLLLPVSPGVRGWTDYFRRHHWKPRVFPRRAGVDPDRGKYAASPLLFPRCAGVDHADGQDNP